MHDQSDIRTFRAPTMQQVLDLVRQELGPSATVLQTRQVGRGFWGRLRRKTAFEVVASASLEVPSRLPERPAAPLDAALDTFNSLESDQIVQSRTAQYRSDLRGDVSEQLQQLSSLVEELCDQSAKKRGGEMPEALFLAFTDLIESDVDEAIARELIDNLRTNSPAAALTDALLVKAKIANQLEEEIRVAGPIAVESGSRRTVALVGPTGVGKTTTIAKLAANYRLREKKRVGLITVDTYRIAAVEQLRTYADIIDLPMEVVATPREMRQAIARTADLDLVLVDTAGRSPRDEVKIQELKSMLAEAAADEVHLVVSCVASTKSLLTTVERFHSVGTTSLILTKLDEATTFGSLVPVIRDAELPFSYLTDGQNVPDDIRIADARDLTRLILGLDAQA